MRKVLLSTGLYFLFLFSLYSDTDFSYESMQEFYEQQLNLSKDQSDSILDFHRKDLELIEKIYTDNKVSEDEIYEILAFSAKAENFDKYDEVINLLRTVIPWLKEQPQQQAFLYYKLGGFYFHQHKLVQSIEQFMKAILIFEQIGDSKSLARAQLNIALINMQGSNDEIGIDYANQSLQIMENLELENQKDSIILRRLYSVKGILHRRVGDYEKALFNTEQSIQLLYAMKDTLLTAIAKGNKAVIYYEMGKLNSALPLLIADYETSKAAGYYSSAFNAGIFICKIYSAKGNLQELTATFNAITQIFEKQGITNKLAIVDYYKIGADLANIKNDQNEENYYLRKYVDVDHARDSINKVNDVAQLQEKYLLEKEVAKLELLKKTNHLQASHLKLRTALLIIIGLALIIVLWYVYVLTQKNKKIDRLNEMLEEKVSERTNRLLEINKELDTYLYRASHDIRRPIRTILGLNNVAKISDNKEELSKLFEQVHFTALNMDKMLFKLQMAYELNNEHPMEEVNIEELIQTCISNMILEIETHKAEIKINIPNNALYVQANHALILMMLNNILENSLLYQNHGKPEIEINTDIGKYYFYIHIKDNGYGISEEYYQKVFTSYFKISNKTQGSGLGLFLAERAVNYLGGEITIQSVINKGSHFTIKLPVNPR